MIRYLPFPSSYSTIVRHTNGTCYWVGNITADYPVVIGTIDTVRCLLRRESVMDIDTYRKDDAEPMHLRNFSIHEERSTGDFVMRMTRLWVDAGGHMRSDAWMYRIAPET